MPHEWRRKFPLHGKLLKDAVQNANTHTHTHTHTRTREPRNAYRRHVGTRDRYKENALLGNYSSVGGCTTLPVEGSYPVPNKTPRISSELSAYTSVYISSRLGSGALSAAAMSPSTYLRTSLTSACDRPTPITWGTTTERSGGGHIVAPFPKRKTSNGRRALPPYLTLLWSDHVGTDHDAVEGLDGVTSGLDGLHFLLGPVSVAWAQQQSS